MAQVIENEKGLKVIQVTPSEMINIGCGDICDMCNELVDTHGGYYIAVLNMYVCSECYEKWLKSVTYDERDRWYENANFKNYKNALGL